MTAAEDEEHKPYKSLKHFLEVNNHLDEKNMILKIDIEGMEWEFLNTVESDILKKFDQIIFEFHNIIKPQTINIVKMLEKLNQTHDLVHLHGNNSSNLLKVGYSYIPDVFEATYVNKEKYKISKQKTK